MSAFGGKADIGRMPRCLLMTQSRHRLSLERWTDAVPEITGSVALKSNWTSLSHRKKMHTQGEAFVTGATNALLFVLTANGREGDSI